MNAAILELTVRQLLGKRRTLLMLAFVLLPVGIAVLYRINGHNVDHSRWTASVLEARLLVGTFLPLCALIFGTAALGSEFEDGTAVYLLSKPIPRWRIIVSKLLVAWVATAALALLACLVSGAIAIRDVPDQGILLGFGVALIGGAFVYCCLFVFLSVVTGRALITGLLYVFIWEGLITTLFSGTRVLSVRQYTLGLAKAISNTTTQTFDAKLGGSEAVILMVLVSAIATWLAIRALQRWEIGETG